MLQGDKVISAAEMKRLEERAYQKGASAEEFMESAGLSVADAADDYIAQNLLDRCVYLLLGKGNNGGDGYVAGRKLLSRGFVVKAFALFPPQDESSLCKKQRERFEEAGGEVEIVRTSSLNFDPRGLIIDALLGTGFHGKVEGLLAEVIEKANSSGAPILAVDIPSGLSGTTGEVESLAIRADLTVALGFAKIGFFIGSGWDHVGKIHTADFGLAEALGHEAKAEAHLLNEEEIPFVLPPLKRSRHKYEAGYVLGIAGSETMPGAALLSALAALRSGAGIVRLFYGKHADLSLAAPEIIREKIDKKRIRQELSRARALFMGPGLGRAPSVRSLLHSLLKQSVQPCVLDADALYFLSTMPTLKLRENILLTPHAQEMQRLLGKARVDLAHCQKYIEEKKGVLILKGAPTIVFSSGTLPLIISRGDPGMATAGTGDVLTGVLAALLAQGIPPRHASALGVYLHAVAGELSALEKSSYSMIASDLIDNLSEVFNEAALVAVPSQHR